MIALIGLLLGVFLGLVFDVNIPESFSPYMSVAILACLDSVFGDKLGIPIYISSVIVFGGRIFDNFGAIRRILLERFKNRRRGD